MNSPTNSPSSPTKETVTWQSMVWRISGVVYGLLFAVIAYIMVIEFALMLIFEWKGVTWEAWWIIIKGYVGFAILWHLLILPVILFTATVGQLVYKQIRQNKERGDS